MPQILIKRGLEASLPSSAPVGELYLTTDTNKLLVGTGTSLIQLNAGGNFVQATVNFGFANGLEGDTATITVSAPWVTTSSKIVCSAAAIATLDHSPEDAVVEGILAYATNINPGVGFDIEAVAPQNSWGRYTINAIG